MGVCNVTYHVVIGIILWPVMVISLGNSYYAFAIEGVRILNIYLFIYFYPFERQSNRKRGKEILHLLVHSRNAYDSQSWAKLKSGGWNSIWVFRLGDRCSSTWAVICHLPGCVSRKLNQKWRVAETWTGAPMGVPSSKFNLLCHHACLCFLKKLF